MRHSGNDGKIGRMIEMAVLNSLTGEEADSFMIKDKINS
jgi:hypothetical protein